MIRFFYGLITAAVFTFLLLFTTLVYAAGFNCNYAKLPAEVLICQDQDLSNEDEAMSRVYYSLYNNLDPKKSLLAKLQRAWLKKRNDCGYDKDCLTYYYNLQFKNLCEVAASMKYDLGSDCY